MDRRRAMAAMGGGVVLAGGAAGQPPAPVLRVSVVIPEVYGPDGKLSSPRTLRALGPGLQFHVVVENISPADVYVWAEGNSMGHGALSLEVTADGKTSVVRRIEQVWTRNVLRAERLAPGGHHVRAVGYGNSRDWEPLPFGPAGSQREVALRAVFEQPKVDADWKLAVWAGRVVSAPCRVVLWHG